MIDAMAERLANQVDNLEETVYRGNGKPSLLVRMEVCEKRQESAETTLRRWEKVAVTLAVSAIGSVLSVVGHLVWESVASHIH